MNIEKPSQCSGRHEVSTNNGDLVGGFVVFYHPIEYSMQFFVINVIGMEEGGLPVFESNGDIEQFDTTDPDKARLMLNGWVKWDGCSDMDIGGDGISYRNHFCGHNDAKCVGQMIDLVYELAAQRISTWDL